MARHTNLLPESNDSLMSDASLDLALREQSAHVAGAPPKRNALKMVHRLLRGKYHWLIILGVIFGGAGAAAGWKRGEKTFSSTGAIRINFQLEAVLGNSQDTWLPNAEGFVQDQINAMTSWRVMSRAVAGPQWAKVRPNLRISDNDMAITTLAVQDLVRRVKVSQNTNKVQVEVRDTDPEVAEAGAKAIIGAYRAIYIEHADGEVVDPTMEKLLREKKRLETLMAEIRQQINVIVERRNSGDLDALYNSRRDDLETLRKEIAKLETMLEIAKKEKEEADAAATTQPATRSTEKNLSIEALAMSDDGLSKLMAEKRAAMFAVEMAARGTNAKVLAEKKAYLEFVDKQIDVYYNSLLLAISNGMAIPGVPAIQGESELKAAQVRLDILKPLYVTAKDELEALGDDNRQIHEKRDELKEIGGDLAIFKARIEQLTLEDTKGRRLDVVTEGDHPVLPDKDTRPKFAAAGGMAGMMGAAGLVMLIGYLSGKIKTRRDLQFDLEDKPLIGLIPKLKKGEDSSKLAGTAAEFVHRSRTMLEIWARGSEKMVIGVTSPSHGSGNTSVAMSLGVSFATAGIRTLLVDVDFVTNGLTPRLQTTVRREIGRVLVRQGMISEEKLEHARKVVFEESGGKINGGLVKQNGTNGNGHNGHNGHNGYNGRNGHDEPNGTFTTNAVNPKQGVNQDRILGEACVKLGYITEDQLERALRVQAREPVGLLDALSGEPIENCIGKTGIRNLSILPRGNVTPAHAAKLSTHSMRHVLAIARQQYDTVIVDTSAILTSLEAAIVASSVDGMVMTVARGEKRSRLVEAMNRLSAMGCPVAGAIFNQVSPKDMPPELNIGRVSTMNDNTVDEEMIQANAELVGRLDLIGPLASTMVSRVPVLDQKVAEDE